MSKKNRKKNQLRTLPQTSSPEPAYSLSRHEQDNIMILIQQRRYATLQADSVLRDYILKILAANKLDPTLWGISADYTHFEKLQPPPTQPPASTTLSVNPTTRDGR